MKGKREGEREKETLERGRQRERGMVMVKGTMDVAALAKKLSEKLRGR